MTNLYKEVVYIIILSVFLAFVRYLFLDDYQLLNSKVEKSIVDYEDVNLKNYLLELSSPKVIDIEKAKFIYNNELAIFIDAREKEDYIDGHILNAINIPFNVDDKYEIALLDSLYNLDKTLVIYCSGYGCSLSEDLTYYLYEEKGIESIVYFEEGFPEWKNKNYPIKKSVDDELIQSDKPLFSYIDYIVLFFLILTLGLYFNNNYNYYIPVISRFFLGFIFIYFSLDKISDPKLFAELTRNYDIIPFGIENLGALILPFIEFIIGFCLIAGIFVKSSNFIAMSLLIFFIIMIGQAYLRGKSIDCGCILSDLSASSSYEKRLYMLKRILQDMCFLVFAIIVKYKEKFKINHDT